MPTPPGGPDGEKSPRPLSCLHRLSVWRRRRLNEQIKHGYVERVGNAYRVMNKVKQIAETGIFYKKNREGD